MVKVGCSVVGLERQGLIRSSCSGVQRLCTERGQHERYVRPLWEPSRPRATHKLCPRGGQCAGGLKHVLLYSGVSGRRDPAWHVVYFHAVGYNNLCCASIGWQWEAVPHSVHFGPASTKLTPLGRHEVRIRPNSARFPPSQGGPSTGISPMLANWPGTFQLGVAFDCTRPDFGQLHLTPMDADCHVASWAF